MTGDASDASAQTWGSREIRALRKARGETQEGMALALGVATSTVQRWEIDAQAPTQGQLLCRLNGFVEALTPFQRETFDRARLNTTSSDPPTNGTTTSLGGRNQDGDVCSIGALVQLAAGDSAAFVRELAADSNRPALLEQLHADVHRLAVAGRRAPPARILAEVLPIRQTTFRVIRQERQPTDDKDLLLFSGYLSGILAYAALDLGYSDEAVTNARAACRPCRTQRPASLGARDPEPHRPVQGRLSRCDRVDRGRLALCR
ncbi:MAG: helix-turn-helix domain-containing protein [Egibacteraceae bacterium]